MTPKWKCVINFHWKHHLIKQGKPQCFWVTKFMSRDLCIQSHCKWKVNISFLNILIFSQISFPDPIFIFPYFVFFWMIFNHHILILICLWPCPSLSVNRACVTLSGWQVNSLYICVFVCLIVVPFLFHTPLLPSAP